MMENGLFFFFFEKKSGLKSFHQFMNFEFQNVLISLACVTFISRLDSTRWM